ncbi:MAG TPA: transketolase [Armatimonadota bacterium]
MKTYDAHLDELCINAIRFLAVDAVEQAKSGHPGTPMGTAALAYTLWDRFMKYNPHDPQWPNRDRFILSAGHASMLLYALLYLTGYDLTLDDIKQFRQWGSRTPGHPEFGHTPGVEVTTGPLGQGFGNSVGMAVAARSMACHFNRPNYAVVEHFIYVLASDGDMEEGVSSEAASLAGTLQLGNLIVFYDDNEISIEGSTDAAFRENVGARFTAYGWQVIGPIDGMNTIEVDAAIGQAQIETARPSLIICRTTIGYGSPEQATGKVHGEPLGAEGATAAKHNLGWPLEPTFYVPDEVLQHMRQAVERGESAERAWQQQMEGYAKDYPELAIQFNAQLRGELPAGWDHGLAELFPAGSKAVATRSASGKVINALAKNIPALMGGAGDLAPSTKTLIDDGGDFSVEEPCGRNMHFGVREHAMGSIANGMARYGGVIPYTATFLIFSDYMRPPMRLAALMGIRVVHVFTHDSIALGEDGPTHQPIEQLLGLRSVPNYTLIRPADATETVEAWKAALLNTTGPTGLVLTRQNLPVIDRTTHAPANGLQRGGYVLWQSADGIPQIMLIATGSEVSLALAAGERLAGDGMNVRVVSLPCWALFDKQPTDYRDSVLPPQVRARISIEAATPMGWERYVGPDGIALGIDHFGSSAPGPVNYEKFGFTPEHVVEVAMSLMGR